MGLTAWTRQLGVVQGRIEPTDWTPQDGGSWVMCLGRDLPGYVDQLNVGDSVTVSQGATWNTTGNIVRTPARMRPPSPANLPLGAWWRCSLLIDGVEVVGKTLPPRRQRDFHDMGWCVAHLAGVHTLAFRLELQGAAGAYSVEIPAFYTDAITIDPTGARPLLLNRDPEPNETQVPADTDIAIDLVDVGGAGVDLANTTISVNGVAAFVDGVFQAGFTGPDSATSTPQADTKRVVIDPVATFANQQVVTIRVQSQTVGGGNVIDQSYSFTVERLDGPLVVAVEPIDQFTINVTYDEAVVQGDGTAGDDALNPANYVIEIVEGDCTAALEVVAVAALSATEVQLTTDIEQTRSAAYTLVVSNVRDLFGNEVQP